MDTINDYLEGQVSNINQRYVDNHVDLYVSDKYEEAWEKDFNENEELVKIKKQKEELAKQLAELNSKMSSLMKNMTITRLGEFTAKDVLVFRNGYFSISLLINALTSS